MNERVLNIMLDKRGKNFRDKVYYKLGLSFVRAVDTYHFVSILAGLPLDTLLKVWIHLDASNNPDDPAGLHIGEDLIREYPALKDQIIYVTSNPAAVDNHKNVISYNRVAAYAKDMPPISLRKLLLKTAQKINRVPFRFLKEQEDWRVWAMKKAVSQETLEAILGAVLGNRHHNYRVQVLTPGYSGAYVIRVVGEIWDKDREYLLKISKDEREVSREHQITLEQFFSMLPPSFVGAFPRTYLQVAGWNCLLFHFETGKIPLRNYLRQHLDQPEICKTVIQKLLLDFAPFEKESLIPLLKIKIPPYSGGTFETRHEQLSYTGLQLNDQKTIAVLHALESLENKIATTELATILYDKQDYAFFKHFIQENNSPLYQYQSIESRSENFFTPLSIVHGDFHTANIMIDEQSQSISFIDFANTPSKPIKHALLDIAKLSTDIEIALMPNHLLINDPIFLREWMEAHQKWMEGHTLEEVALHPVLRSIYSMNSLLQDHIRTRLELEGQEKVQQEMLRQFYMIRLHYFLKTISYQLEIREKMIFLIRASIAILKYLCR